MEINLAKLGEELKAAGIPIEGCSMARDKGGDNKAPVFLSEDDEKWYGIIDLSDEATKEQKTQAEAILKAHVPTWYVEQRRKEYPPLEEQFDMWYHDQVNGTTTWKDKIASIKAKYPKN